MYIPTNSKYFDISQTDAPLDGASDNYVFPIFRINLLAKENKKEDHVCCFLVISGIPEWMEKPFLLLGTQSIC